MEKGEGKRRTMKKRGKEGYKKGKSRKKTGERNRRKRGCSEGGRN